LQTQKLYHAGAASESREASDNIDTMDLGGWNFDPSMLGSLTWNDTNTDSASRGGAKKNEESKTTSTTRPSPARLDTSTWDGHLALLSNFGGLDYEGVGSSHRSRASDDGNASQPALESGPAGSNSQAPSLSHSLPPTVSEAVSVNSATKDGGASSVASRTTAATQMSQNTGGPQLHPMGIQSSATCPPHSNAAGTQESTNSASNSYLQQAVAGLFSSQQYSTDYLGLHGVDSSAVASLAASFQNPSNSGNNNHFNSLAANFFLAQARPQESNLATAAAPPHQAHTRAATVPASQPHSNETSSSSSPVPVFNATVPLFSGQPTGTPGSSGSKPPPFYLFDAPVELRTNFMANQRKLGLPVEHDPNSYHFGESVKGFHPQQVMNQQQLNAMVSNSGQVNRIPDAPVQLIDARHGGVRSASGRVKNEREQKRAQKITELIEQLRQDMEKEGWKVEMRSKSHTLSR